MATPVNQVSCQKQLERYREFVENLIHLTAGGPPAGQLVAAIEDGTINMHAVHMMLAGEYFRSYTEEPHDYI